MLMKAVRRLMLMNPPGATDVLSIRGLDGTAFKIAEAATMGFAGPPGRPCQTIHVANTTKGQLSLLSPERPSDTACAGGHV